MNSVHWSPFSIHYSVTFGPLGKIPPNGSRPVWTIPGFEGGGDGRRCVRTGPAQQLHTHKAPPSSEFHVRLWETSRAKVQEAIKGNKCMPPRRIPATFPTCARFSLVQSLSRRLRSPEEGEQHARTLNIYTPQLAVNQRRLTGLCPDPEVWIPGRMFSQRFILRKMYITEGLNVSVCHCKAPFKLWYLLLVSADSLCCVTVCTEYHVFLNTVYYLFLDFIQKVRYLLKLHLKSRISSPFCVYFLDLWLSNLLFWGSGHNH